MITYEELDKVEKENYYGGATEWVYKFANHKATITISNTSGFTIHVDGTKLGLDIRDKRLAKQMIVNWVNDHD